MNKRILGILFCILLVSAVPAWAAPVWSDLEPLPEARWGGAYVTDGEYLYYIGGGVDWDVDLEDTVYRYDPAGDAWDELEPLPEPLGQIDAGVIGRKIYVPGGYIGGSDNTATLYIYDIDSDSWSTGEEHPYSGGLEGYAVEVYEEKLYLMGGFSFSIGWSIYTYVYDPVGDEWEQLANMNHGGWEIAAWTYEGMIYTAGGNGPFAILDTAGAEVYDPVGDSWSDVDMADLPAERVAGADAVGEIGGSGRLYYFGGYNISGDIVSTVYSYNVDGDSWAGEPPLAMVNEFAEADCLNGKFYLAGGSSDDLVLLDAHIVWDFGVVCPNQPTTTTTTSTTTTTMAADDDSSDDTAADDTATDDDVDDVTDDAGDAAGGDDDDGGCCGC